MGFTEYTIHKPPEYVRGVRLWCDCRRIGFEVCRAVIDKPPTVAVQWKKDTAKGAIAQ